MPKSGPVRGAATNIDRYEGVSGPALARAVPEAAPSTPVATEAAHSESAEGVAVREGVHALPGDVVVPHSIGPLVLLAADPSERWVSVCMATEDTNGDDELAVSANQRGELSGDRLAPYLLRSQGAPIQLTEWVAADANGRFVLGVEGAQLVLRDLPADRSWDLSVQGATTLTDTAPFLPHRSGSFSPLGTHLVYLAGKVGEERAIIRDLRDHSETTVAVPRGELWRVSFDTTGRWIVLHVADIDSNGDGEIQWPHDVVESGRSSCRSPIPTYRFRPFRPADVPSHWVVSVQGGEPRRVRRFVSGFGDGWLRRRSDRAIFWDRPGQPSVLISRSACNGRALHVDPFKLLLVVACAGEDDRRSVELVGPELHHEIDALVDNYEFDRLSSSGPRLVALQERDATRVLDLETRVVRSLQWRDRVLGSHEDTLAVARKNVLMLGKPDRLVPVSTFDRLGVVQREGRWLLVPPYLVDLEAGRIAGRLRGTGLAVSRLGKVLTPTVPGGSHQLARGPLVWQQPR